MSVGRTPTVSITENLDHVIDRDDPDPDGDGSPEETVDAPPEEREAVKEATPAGDVDDDPPGS